MWSEGTHTHTHTETLLQQNVRALVAQPSRSLYAPKSALKKFISFGVLLQCSHSPLLVACNARRCQPTVPTKRWDCAPLLLLYLALLLLRPALLLLPLCTKIATTPQSESFTRFRCLKQCHTITARGNYCRTTTKTNNNETVFRATPCPHMSSTFCLTGAPAFMLIAAVIVLVVDCCFFSAARRCMPALFAHCATLTTCSYFLSSARVGL